MKNCPHCSATVRTEAVYCNQCGSHLAPTKKQSIGTPMRLFVIAFAICFIVLAIVSARKGRQNIPQTTTHVETIDERVTRERDAFNAMSSAEHLAAARISKDCNNEDLFKARQHLAAIPKSAPEYRQVAALRAAADRREKELWKEDGRAAVATVSPTPSTPESSRRNTGRDNERRFSPDGAEAAVGTTVEAFNDLTQAATRGDKYGFAEVFFSGRAFVLQRGTRVLVRDVGFLKTQIRVLEGPQEGKSGWVPSEWVR